MTRNQKIALGCGGAGCLGLIVVAIAGCAVYFLVYRTPAYRARRDYTFNVNYNSNANSNSVTNENSNSNANENSNSNDNSRSASSTSSLSEDDKHKLFHAATVTNDTELINRVNVKIGILNEDFTPGDQYQQFVADHIVWTFKNTDFIRTINTPEKARAYVNAHFPE